ncbi:MAG: hypothetical protein IJZ30_06920 [Alphaproteobacteria bacterium]|nr:hypothetical protein [Alphaproteobacteria bacterium]
MEIEYIYPDPDDKDLKKQIKQMQRENTLGCLVLGLFILGGLFLFLTMLPIILVVFGYSILFLSVYILYKAYLEDFVLTLIDKIKNR